MGAKVTQLRKQAIRQLIETCHETDNSELEAEKTEVIEELLVEVERLADSRNK